MIWRLFVSAALISLLASARPALAQTVRLAVTDFTDGSAQGSLGHLGRGLQSMLTTDLSAASTYSIVERARLADVLAELKLQQRAEIDAKTAVAIGKLLGASHLASGSVTVYGEKMRIDCRLVAVESGAVLLAEKVEGDKSAFFELEKTLVQKLVKSLGVKVEPKQRAVMAQVHTADFEAFRNFSEGVAYFDAKKYDDAVRAMRTATQIDTEFKLARITLSGYEDLIVKAGVASKAAVQFEAATKQLADNEKAKLASAIIEKLMAITRKKDVPAERALAFLCLAETFDRESPVPEPLGSVTHAGDRFAQQRAVESYYKGYWFAALEAFPEVPLIPDYLEPPLRLSSFDADFATALSKLRASARNVTLRWDRLLLSWFAGILQLDGYQTAELAERLLRLSIKLKPEPAWASYRQLDVARCFQHCLDLDRSTAHVLEAQNRTTKWEVMSGVREQLGINRDLARALELPTRFRQELREALADNLGGDLARKQSDPDSEPGEILKKSAAVRKVENGSQDYVLLGDEPLWELARDEAVTTGPRSVPKRATELRYVSSSVGTSSTLVAGRAPASTFRISLKASGVAQPLSGGKTASATSLPEQIPGERPTLSVHFGLSYLCDWNRNAQGFAVRITSRGARLVKLSAAEPCRISWNEQTLAEQPFLLSSDQPTRVEVKLVGNNIQVVVDGHTWSTPAPSSARGFLGIGFDGVGDASVSELRFSR